MQVFEGPGSISPEHPGAYVALREAKEVGLLGLRQWEESQIFSGFVTLLCIYVESRSML